jgi:hypothetical protein
MVGGPMKGKLALLIAVVAIAGGIAFATIPDSEGVIHACYGQDGSLRVIDDSTGKCRPHEKPLTWSQGTTGISGYVSLVSEPHPVAAHSRDEGSLNCPEGLNVLSGGARDEFSLGDLFLIGLTFAPVDRPTQVTASMRNDTDNDRSFFVYAICAKVTP